MRQGSFCVRSVAWGASPERIQGTFLCDPRSPSKHKTCVGACSGQCCLVDMWYSPAQNVSFGLCCPSAPSLKDFRQGNKKVFLCRANIYIPNIWCLCLVTNISARKWEAFRRKGGTGDTEAVLSCHCICTGKPLEITPLHQGNIMKITKSSSQKLTHAGVGVICLTFICALVPVLSDYLIYPFGFTQLLPVCFPEDTVWRLLEEIHLLPCYS